MCSSPCFFMGVSILRNRLNPYNSLYFNKLQAFRSIGDMLIGSKIPPQADIIKFVIAGGDLYPSHNTDTFPLPENHFVGA